MYAAAVGNHRYGHSQQKSGESYPAGETSRNWFACWSRVSEPHVAKYALQDHRQWRVIITAIATTDVADEIFLRHMAYKSPQNPACCLTHPQYLPSIEHLQTKARLNTHVEFGQDTLQPSAHTNDIAISSRKWYRLRSWYNYSFSTQMLAAYKISRYENMNKE